MLGPVTPLRAVSRRQPGGVTGFPALLLEKGAISQRDLLVAEQDASHRHVELVDALVTLGLLSEADAYTALAQSASLDVVDLSDTVPSELAIRLVPERLARRHLVVPLSLSDDTLTYATCRPFDHQVEGDLVVASGRRTHAMVAPRSAIFLALDRCYPRLHDLDLLAARLSAERATVENDTDVGLEASESAVTSICNRLLARAVEVGASAVHIDCSSERTSVRYRICGVLEPVLALPAVMSLPIRNRLKTMAYAGIGVHQGPDDGAVHLRVDGRLIDIRCSTMPTLDGEKIVMRIIDNQSPLHSLESLGYDADTLARLRRSLGRPDGLVLVTGPTGSGKTTALYAALAHLQTGRTNIVTVEDPVERTVAGVTQVPVNVRGGNTFASVLRSLVRQEPGVIMVGEICDEEVAQIVGQAATTGHLVLSSMRASDAATAITRLTNLGVEPYTVAESLSAVLAQRLLRTLCPHCRRAHDDIEARRRGTEHHLPSIPFSAGSGCQRCKYTGYMGRVPVAELLTPTDALRDTIAHGATVYDIRAAMRVSKSPTMRDRALELVAHGVTSIEEVDRVLADDASVATVHARPLVLVADDEPVTRMLVKLLLEREQYQVLEATNGQEAVEIATREHPDLLVIDLNMPVMDGYDAIVRLRHDLSLATTPIIVLTAEEGPGVERRVLDLGADDYVVKPFDPDVFLSRVNAVFRRIHVMAA